MNLQSRIVTVLLTVSLLPIFLMGAGAWIVFGRLLERKSLELQRTVVESHSRAIETYLSERLNALRLLTSTHSLQQITDSNLLNQRFSILLKETDGGFVDLGVIGSDGQHLAYVGPYDLMEKNYRNAEWFKQVMEEETYISDVFLGFRQVPHCIIAVKASNGGTPWILRGTINSMQFDKIVQTGVLGERGDVFIVNRQGIYQTTSKSGSVMEPSDLSDMQYVPGVHDCKISIDGQKKIQVTTWINEGKWLLVARQDAGEVHAPVNRAVAAGAVIVSIAVVLIVLTTFFATRHLTGLIDRANARREETYRAFTRSAKLASVGELATGLAHEINNPLAIISADQTNIKDILSDLPEDFRDRNDLLESVERIKRQIGRCRSITTKMLQFGRKDKSKLEPTNVTSALRETVSFLERQASVRNVELLLDLDDMVPSVMIDTVELEQVLINLINNSFQALPEGGRVQVVSRSDGSEVVIEVIDNGYGIHPKDIDRIFEPFFTTKSVGEGTGLGLSVCYGIVKSWGGTMEAESEFGKGTIMRMFIPIPSQTSHNKAKSTEVAHE